ncbi:hypothetical protein F4553_007508 [Allocatelliglobosispora scoriae]|uniref:WXG100 family type VII secretion target n=1 Tax=Allocatelliglobosispora scoriae TaxID=643052 RepID=A0A841C129_9ACTN|nr:hypothetical protein [Allocatelliglobosispora scoriae]MBB5874074.1 hypothetical protein [Allocatelliglobosispora scoriae]
MSTYVGADPVQLDALGEHLLSRAALLDELRLRLTAELFDTGWAGPDAEDARSDWDASHAPALGSAAQLFHAMSQTLFANAGAQRDASAGEVALAALYTPRIPFPGPDATPEELQAYWLAIAADRAGIDMSVWDPALGATVLKDTVTDVYTYYGKLFLENPNLQWAGMANMVGPSLSAGFFDIEMFRDLAAKFAGLPGVPPGMDLLANASEAELKFYETTFLQMEKDVFTDMAMQHEAYLGAGMPGIQQLGDAGLIDAQTVQAWEKIDLGTRTGDQDLVMQGNEELLHREQWTVLDRNYQLMYDHSPTGPAFTYAMTAIGEPSIPGAHGFGEYRPFEFTQETPGPDRIPFTPWDNPLQGSVTVTTPFPDGNLANFNDRWDYITHDTLPAFQDLLRNDPDQARAIISSDVVDRTEDNRIYNRLDTLGEHYFTDWKVDFDQ